MITVSDLIAELGKSVYFLPRSKYNYLHIEMYAIACNMLIGGTENG